MKALKDHFDVASAFHGHRCPAMPMGLQAELAAITALGVERAKDKELVVESETGEGHAAGCFLDGVMVATGAAYGKGNIKKLFYNKMASTLINEQTGKVVRVSLKPEFFEKALQSPFAQKRKEGVAPQDIPAEITDLQVEGVLGLPESGSLVVSQIFHRALKKGATSFEVKRCAQCGEATFINKLAETSDSQLLCTPCALQEMKA